MDAAKLSVTIDAQDGLKQTDTLEQKLLKLVDTVDGSTKRLQTAFDRLAKSIESTVLRFEGGSDRISRASRVAAGEISNIGTAAEAAAGRVVNAFDRVALAQQRILTNSKQIAAVSLPGATAAGVGGGIALGSGAFAAAAAAAGASASSPTITRLFGQSVSAPDPLLRLGGGSGGSGPDSSDIGGGGNDPLSRFGMYGRLMLGIYAARKVVDMGDALLKSQADYEKIVNTLTIVDGSVAKATQDFGYLQDEADRVGVSFLSTSEAFSKFAAATRGTSLQGEATKRIFESVVEASRRLGLSGAETGHVFLALEQMVSKGIISMEELRRQLGNALPGAMQIAAQSMGVTTAQFEKMVKSGEVMAEDFLPNFARRLHEIMPAGESVNSTAAAIDRLSNSWERFKQSAMGGVIGGTVRAGLKDVTNIVSGPSVMERHFQDLMERSYERGGNGGFLSLAGDTLFGATSQLWNDPDYLASLTNRDRLQAILARKPSSSVRRATGADGKVFRYGLNEMPGNGADFGPAPFSPNDEQQKAQKELEALFRKMNEGSLSDFDKLNREALDKFQTQTERIEELTKKLKGSPEEFGKFYTAAFDELTNRQKEISALEGKSGSKTSAELTLAQEEFGRLQVRINENILPEGQVQVQRIKDKYAEFRNELVKFQELGIGVPGDTYDKLAQAEQEEIKKVESSRSFMRRIEQYKTSSYEDLVAARDSALRHKTGLNPEQESAVGSVATEELRRRMEAGQLTGRQGLQFGFHEADRELGTTAQRMAAIGSDVSSSMVGSLSSGFTKILFETKNFGQVWESMWQQIAADVVQAVIRETLVKGIVSNVLNLGSALAGGFGGLHTTTVAPSVDTASAASVSNIAHTGGIIGYDSLQSRMVNPASFYSVRRFHGGGVTGLRSNEAPVVTEKGEGVFTQHQMRALGAMINSGGRQKVEIMNVFDEEMIDRRIAANPDLILNAVSRRKSALKQILLG